MTAHAKGERGATSSRALSLKGLSVFLGMPTHRDIPPATVAALLGTADLMRTRGIPFQLHLGVGGSIVSFSRSKAAWDFLQSDKSRLFWVDSDIVWEAEDFLRLLALSSELPVVGAMYPSKSDPPTFFVNFDDALMETNEFGCVAIGGFGLGFTCVQRAVMQALADKAPKRKYPDVREPIPAIFRIDEFGDEARGEDVAFFHDIRALGHTVWLDPNVTLGHIGQKVYTASIKEHFREEHPSNGTSHQPSL